jgi:hypothetical protein
MQERDCLGGKSRTVTIASGGCFSKYANRLVQIRGLKNDAARHVLAAADHTARER